MRRTLTAMAITGMAVFTLLVGVATANASTALPRIDGVDSPTNRGLLDLLLPSGTDEEIDAVMAAIDALVEGVVG